MVFDQRRKSITTIAAKSTKAPPRTRCIDVEMLKVHAVTISQPQRRHAVAGDDKIIEVVSNRVIGIETEQGVEAAVNSFVKSEEVVEAEPGEAEGGDPPESSEGRRAQVPRDGGGHGPSGQRLRNTSRSLP